MKKTDVSGRFRKVIFVACCLLLALIFWFVTKYNQLGGFPVVL